MKEREKRRRHHRRGKEHSAQEPQVQAVQSEQPRGGDRFRQKAVLLTALATSVVVALSSEYSLHHLELLSSYGKDFIGPLFTWSSVQLVSHVYPKLENWARSKRPLIIYSTYALGMELFQYHFANIQEQGNLPGRYDPWDLATFGAGTAFALAVNKFILRKK